MIEQVAFLHFTYIVYTISTPIGLVPSTYMFSLFQIYGYGYGYGCL